MNDICNLACIGQALFSLMHLSMFLRYIIKMEIE